MSLSVSHNMMAVRTSRRLNSHYRSMGDSLRHLSSGLRVERAADDAARGWPSGNLCGQTLPL